MKIVKLQSENIKRLHAVEITPEGTMVVVGGKNGAGKTSVLDSIAYAIGGEKLVPSQPIRNGETDAKVVADLGDLIVTRKFHRARGACTCEVQQAEAHAASCGTKTLGPTTSTLIVTNKDGARYPSPQALLDKLVGKLTFDPLAFSREPAAKQNEILRRLVNVDFTLLDQQRKEAATQRAMLKKTHDIRAAQLLTLPVHKDAPPEESSLEDESLALVDAEELRSAADGADRDAEKAAATVRRIADHGAKLRDEIEKLERQLALLVDEKVHNDANYNDALRDVNAKRAAATAARELVPDFEALRQRLLDVNTMNGKVQANKKHADASAEVSRIEEQIKGHTATIEHVDQTKANALASVKFPVPGLGLSDDGVTFDGLPLEEVAASVQLRTSIAIGIALNPDLKILLIRNGNLLDNDSLKAVAEQAEDAGVQCWCEYVTDSDEGVSVFIEDGSIRSLVGVA